jgi:hypothetical protein
MRDTVFFVPESSDSRKKQTQYMMMILLPVAAFIVILCFITGLFFSPVTGILVVAGGIAAFNIILMGIRDFPQWFSGFPYDDDE